MLHYLEQALTAPAPSRRTFLKLSAGTIGGLLSSTIGGERPMVDPESREVKVRLLKWYVLFCASQ